MIKYFFGNLPLSRFFWQKHSEGENKIAVKSFSHKNLSFGVDFKL